MTREIPIPTDPDEREWRERDVAAYEANERLHDAYEQLAGALHELLNVIGMTFAARHEPLFRGKVTPERLAGARKAVDAAQQAWAAAVAHADELLAGQEGGEWMAAEIPIGPFDELPIANLLNGVDRANADGDCASAAAGLLAVFPLLEDMDDASVEKTLADVSPGAARLVAAEAISQLRSLRASIEQGSDN